MQMWVFDWKADEYGWPTKTKARLVARGEVQRMNIGSGELFAPTVAVSSVRLLTAMACELDLDSCAILILSRLSCSLTSRKLFTCIRLRVAVGCQGR